MADAVLDSSETQILDEWFRRAVLSQHGHYNAATHFRRLHYWFGIPVVCISAFVGTAVFATLQQEVTSSARILVGLTSVGASVLAALQTFFGFAERRERHRAAGARYGALRRSIEVVLAQPQADGGQLRESVQRIKDELDALGLEAPEIPRRVWETAERYYDKRPGSGHASFPHAT